RYHAPAREIVEAQNRRHDRNPQVAGGEIVRILEGRDAERRPHHGRRHARQLVAGGPEIVRLAIATLHEPAQRVQHPLPLGNRAEHFDAGGTSALRGGPVALVPAPIDRIARNLVASIEAASDHGVEQCLAANWSRRQLVHLVDVACGREPRRSRMIRGRRAVTHHEMHVRAGRGEPVQHSTVDDVADAPDVWEQRRDARATGRWCHRAICPKSAGRVLVHSGNSRPSSSSSARTCGVKSRASSARISGDILSRLPDCRNGKYAAFLARWRRTGSDRNRSISLALRWWYAPAIGLTTG